MDGIVILVRHGATAATEEGKFCGRRDLPLSNEGEHQAKSIAGMMALERPGRILSSPLARARQTAGITAQGLGLPVELAPELFEADFGEWDGLSFDEVQKRYPGEYGRFRSLDIGFAFPGGEPLADFCDRVRSAAEIIRGALGPKPVAVFSHGGVIRHLICEFMGLDFSKSSSFYIPPAGVARIVISGSKGALMSLGRAGDHI
ncbi:MAG: histidine phosphatase family protein [Nitrospinae bacterium]|nr:histidine phosphatase family protein [Nitrospinota bacterium]